MSILPLRINAGSRFSTKFVVNTIIFSLLQADHNPSMAFSNSDKVTLLCFACLSLLHFSSSSSSSSSSFFFFLYPVKSSEQSISSITKIEFSVASNISFFSSKLSFTVVNSRSYTSYSKLVRSQATLCLFDSLFFFFSLNDLDCKYYVKLYIHQDKGKKNTNWSKDDQNRAQPVRHKKQSIKP